MNDKTKLTKFAFSLELRPLIKKYAMGIFQCEFIDTNIKTKASLAYGNPSKSSVFIP